MYKFLSYFIFFAASISLAYSQRFYIKPQVNFQFPVTTTIRQDYLPFSKVENNHWNAVIMHGIRFEYIKSNGNGYFFNFGTVPIGFAVRYRDYALIDPYYEQRAVNYLGASDLRTSSTHDALVFDFGFINKLATVNLSKKKAFDLKIGYGLTFLSTLPFNPQEHFNPSGTNSMNKKYEIIITDYRYYDESKSKSGILIPLKLNFNIKNKIKNVELLDFEFAYWHGLSRADKFNFEYHNITDNVSYNNAIESRGTTWQMSVQIPIRIKRIGKLKF